jgi:CubicO group peptidase (beta-lactamase class C family)
MTTAIQTPTRAVENELIATLGFDLPRLHRVRPAIRAAIDAGHCHGASLMVARHGQIVLDITEGYADRKAGRALGADAVFATMSVAKQFTNVLALSLVERGLLKLHAPIAEWIPEFAKLGKGKVNLFHLLTHTSGILSAIPAVQPEVLMNIDKLVDFACGLPLESQPGERVNYSILLGHTLIAALCLRADGRDRSYAQMLREDVFEPLGMHHTSLGPRADLLARLCPVRVAYENIPALLPPEAARCLLLRCAASGGPSAFRFLAARALRTPRLSGGLPAEEAGAALVEGAEGALRGPAPLPAKVARVAEVTLALAGGPGVPGLPEAHMRAALLRLLERAASLTGAQRSQPLLPLLFFKLALLHCAAHPDR